MPFELENTMSPVICSGLHSVGSVWAPNASVDSQHLWAWLRLVVLLVDIERRRVVDPRRAALSALELIDQASLDLADLEEQLIDRIIGDMGGFELSVSRQWAVLTSRLAALRGHERVVQGLSNADRAELRATWHKRFEQLGLKPEQSTRDMADVLHRRLDRCRERLYESSRASELDLRPVFSGWSELRLYLDEEEESILQEAEELVRKTPFAPSVQRLPQAPLLEMIEARVADISGKLSGSASLLLQESLSTMLLRCAQSVNSYRDQLRSVSEPRLIVELESDRLPLSLTPGSRFDVALRIRNIGNAPARNVEIRLLADELEQVDDAMAAGTLAPGSEARFAIPVKMQRNAPSVTLALQLEWWDDFEQEFSATREALAEDERPSSWTADDVNPFTLGSISDPARLVGREKDVRTIEDVVRAGGSLYVTGQKRVGKTSLIRVLLQVLGDRGWPTYLLPLGRALGEPARPSDLVASLLDALRDAFSLSHPNLTLPDYDEGALPDNFARVAGRWIGRVSRLRPPDVQAVVAIDDLDELPHNLVEGPEADALFLFLRTLVDEGWLNLIFVGSESLPMIIRAQEHKLNQVVPIRVDNFTSREDTKQLATVPSATRLDWHEPSVDQLHYLSGGNPYPDST